jgi:flagellar biosynthetic protein FliR
MLVFDIAQVQLFVLAFTRIMAALVQVPMLAGRAVPNRIRVPLGLVLTLLLVPWTPVVTAPAEMTALGFGAALVRELVLGFVIGFAAQLTFGALQTAGELMGLAGGFANGRVFNPALESNSTALDQLFLMMAMLLFMLFNGHHLVLLSLAHTFTLAPVAAQLPALTVDRALVLAQTLITAGVVLALPVMGASFLTDAALGLVARVAPQIQIFFLEGPLKIAVVLLTLSTGLGVIAPGVITLVRDIGPHMLWLVGG